MRTYPRGNVEFLNKLVDCGAGETPPPAAEVLAHRPEARGAGVQVDGRRYA